MHALILPLYNLIFFWKFWKNPYLNCTSEMATTFFPHFVWFGRTLAKGKFPFKDEIYYKYPGAIPFLASFYLPQIILSLSVYKMSLNLSLKIYTYFILSHFILGSLITYYMFLRWCDPPVALFGAVTLFYSGYSIKIQQPTIIYTMAWIPGIFFDGPFGILSMAMALYGGYYPILIYLMPFIIVIHTKTVLLGILFALPQLIPFLWYYLKSVRLWAKDLSGKVPPWKLWEFIIPVRNRTHTNGVMFMEMQMYTGIAIFFIWFSHSRFWLVLVFALLVATGSAMKWDRIPARALYLATLALAVLATDGLHLSGIDPVAILLLQAALLLFNLDIYPSFPFTQWWRKPSEYYKSYVYPGTHYLKETKSKPMYQGAFSLK